MKFIRILFVIVLILAFCFMTVREICRAWITVEAMKANAPIFKTKTNSPAK